MCQPDKHGGFDDIGAEMDLAPGDCKAIYIQLIRRDANRARRSQRTAP